MRVKGIQGEESNVKKDSEAMQFGWWVRFMHYQRKTKLEWKGEVGPNHEGLALKAQSVLSKQYGVIEGLGAVM